MLAVWGLFWILFWAGEEEGDVKNWIRALTCLSFHQPHVCRLRTFKGLNKLPNLREIFKQTVKVSDLGRQLTDTEATSLTVRARRTQT